ncbi:MerR family transcriptional regulator [Bacillus andreraoultii]|uniref:MerR family transcriptional regulator n=1 Tax=Bacillus andreraoultii TaxID=1499685 RepID=UPI00053B7212|nr:MerR family transcriptional regulator [Bacillus andreraoultii]
MEYTIQKLANIAGISTRTLRYYDEIDLLKPAKMNSSGYRIYGGKEVNRLQQIMFYRELGVPLETIKEIISNPNFDEKAALQSHLHYLLEKKAQIDLLIDNVRKTIANKKGGKEMSDQERFIGFKKQLIEENEKKYGKEIREKYGKETVDASNKKLIDMSETEYNEANKLSGEINAALREAMKTGNPQSEQAKKVAFMHKKWLSYYWPQYSEEAHRGLAQMYVDDERFKSYYDEIELGAAQFLRDAIFSFTKK